MKKELTKSEAINELEYGRPILMKGKDGNTYRLTITQDDASYWDNPRDWDNLCTIASIRGDWDISDRGFSLTADSFDDLVNDLRKDPNVAMRPIYMYDHSGQTISLIPFGDPWDSGLCGVISAEKDKVFDWFGDECTEENWKDLALKAMESEIKVYDEYIRGEVYYYELEKQYQIECKRLDNGETWIDTGYDCVDSYGGFYGDIKESILDGYNIDLDKYETFYEAV